MKVVPPRPAGMRHLPEKCLKGLRKKGLKKIQPGYLRHVMTQKALQEANGTGRKGSFHLSDDGLVLFLVWRIKRQGFTKLLRSASWKQLAGRIRNQLHHIICWAYGASDLTSITRVIRGWEQSYVPLCAWYLSSHVEPEMLGKDPDAEENHVCYGNMMGNALEYIARKGIPEELSQHRVFDCRQTPPSAKERKHYIKSVRNFVNLERALAHLHIQPIGASLIDFPELWIKGKSVYRGPLAPDSHCLGYHAVIMLAVEMFMGEQVVLCKMSNGKRVGDKGYIRVSLEVMYLILGAEREAGKKLRPTPRPKPLLSNFVCPLMDEAPIGYAEMNEAPRGDRKRKGEQEPKISKKRRTC